MIQCLRTTLMLLLVTASVTASQASDDPAVYRLALGDFLPVMRDVLRSEGVHAFIEEVFAEDLGGPTFDLEARARDLEGIADDIPVRVDLEVGASAMQTIDGLMRVVLHGLMAAAEAVQDDREAQVVRQEREVVAAVKSIPMPRITARLRFREESTAKRLFAATIWNLGKAAEQQGLETEFDEDSLSITAPVLASLGVSKLVVAAFLNELGWVRSDGSRANDVTRVVDSWRIGFAAFLDGSDVCFVVGSPVGDEPERLDIVDLPLGEDLVVTRWDHAHVVKAVTGWLSEVDALADTDTGAIFAAMDSEDLVGSLRVIHRNLVRSPVRGEARGRVVEDGYEILVHGNAVKGAPTLGASKLLDWLPPECPGFGVDATASLAEVFESVMLRFEDRLAKEGLKAEMRDDEERAGLLADVEEYWYSGALADFRHQVVHASHDVFLPAYGWVVEEGGLLKVHLSRGRGQAPFELPDIPWLRVALMGRVHDAKLADEWMKETLNALALGVAAAQETSVPDDPQHVELIDLQLGTPTWGLSWDALRRATGLEPDQGERFEGDLQLHWFFHDDWMVISLSPSLSRELLTRFEDPASGPSARAPARAGELSRGHLRLAAVGTVAKGFIRIVTAKFAGPSGSSGDEMEAFIHRWIDHCVASPMDVTWQSSQQEDRRESLYRLVTR